MIHVKQFTFNPFQENTFLLYNDTKTGAIIDPGCYEKHEKEELRNFININDIKLSRLLNTHCHIDHVFGNKFVADEFNLELEMHELDLPVLNSVSRVADLYSIPNVDESPQPSIFLEEGMKIELGNDTLDIIFVPGHAPGHIAFISHADRFVIGGDCLFQMSIGRTDLPGGDHETLLTSIREKFFTLPDNYTVYCGHGSETNIGFEKQHNPFLKVMTS